MNWSQFIDSNKLRFGYNKEQREKLDEVIEDFKGDTKVSWHEEDGPIEVCVYYLRSVEYKRKTPVLVEVWEWDNDAVDEQGDKVPAPLRYDYFLGLVNCSEWVYGASEEDVKNIINEGNKLRYSRGLFKKPSLEDALKKALADLQKRAK
jgi:hypothetical protein